MLLAKILIGSVALFGVVLLTSATIVAASDDAIENFAASASDVVGEGARRNKRSFDLFIRGLFQQSAKFSNAKGNVKKPLPITKAPITRAPITRAPLTARPVPRGPAAPAAVTRGPLRFGFNYGLGAGPFFTINKGAYINFDYDYPNFADAAQAAPAPVPVPVPARPQTPMGMLMMMMAPPPPPTTARPTMATTAAPTTTAPPLPMMMIPTRKRKPQPAAPQAPPQPPPLPRRQNPAAPGTYPLNRRPFYGSINRFSNPRGLADYDYYQNGFARSNANFPQYGAYDDYDGDDDETAPAAPIQQPATPPIPPPLRTRNGARNRINLGAAMKAAQAAPPPPQAPRQQTQAARASRPLLAPQMQNAAAPRARARQRPPAVAPARQQLTDNLIYQDAQADDISSTDDNNNNNNSNNNPVADNAVNVEDNMAVENDEATTPTDDAANDVDAENVDDEVPNDAVSDDDGTGEADGAGAAAAAPPPPQQQDEDYSDNFVNNAADFQRLPPAQIPQQTPPLRFPYRTLSTANQLPQAAPSAPPFYFGASVLANNLGSINHGGAMSTGTHLNPRSIDLQGFRGPFNGYTSASFESLHAPAASLQYQQPQLQYIYQ